MSITMLCSKSSQCLAFSTPQAMFYLFFLKCLLLLWSPWCIFNLIFNYRDNASSALKLTALFLQGWLCLVNFTFQKCTGAFLKAVWVPFCPGFPFPYSISQSLALFIYQNVTYHLACKWVSLWKVIWVLQKYSREEVLLHGEGIQKSCF